MSFSFAQTQSTPDSATGVEGVITLGPIHGGPVREGMPSSRPLSNTTFLVAGNKGAAVEFTTDDGGHFRISLAPGHYSVSLKEKKGGIGHYGPFKVDVVAGQVTKVQWNCDTGMR
jgi:hypothetical protein